MDYIESITEAIGKTPLLKLSKLLPAGSADVFVKLENLNPSGSYKDRMALAMVEGAERGDTWNGRKLPAGGMVVEASAGNTAPALAMVCAAKGYKAHFMLYRYMFEKGDDARMLITKAYGPEVEPTSDPLKYLTAEQIELLKEDEPDLIHVMTGKMDCSLLEAADPASVWVDQIYNKYNYLGQKAIAYEVYEQLDGKVDAIGCSVGAGGSLYGLCLGLKDKGLRPGVIFGVVPSGSEVYLDLKKDECTRAEFAYSDRNSKISTAMGLEKWLQEKSIIQQMVEAGYPDMFFRVTAQEARDMANRLCQELGIYCGMSSGANVVIALRMAQRLGQGKNVVTTIVDRRDRHMFEIPKEKYAV
ncbi:MAG: pyridoxal-phosphate dependent enzyme [Christensenellaceae bacterium]|jgi:cysteine synthase A|nr:pyridoxal-phosphate dependent enzyme [Christensenellaceae bacterium]